MMSKRLIFLISTAVIILAIVAFFRWSEFGLSLYTNTASGGILLLLIVGAAALVDSINPCAFSVLLLTVAFLFSLGKSRTKILQIGGVYIFGIFVVYMLIGLSIIEILQFFNMPHFAAKIGAGIIILFGLISVIGSLFPSFPIRLKIPNMTHGKIAFFMEKASLPAAFILGVLVGLFEFPCTGGPYLLVLGLLHDSATYVKGMGYLVFYNLVFVLPLIIILLISSDNVLVEKVNIWKKTRTGQMRVWGGVFMIILGIVVFIL